MKLLITTSTMPASEDDAVPAFVKDQAVHLKSINAKLDILIHSPHNDYSNTRNYVEDNSCYRDIRFHYFWPFRYERLAGRGIMPALKAQPLLYAQIPFLFFCQFFSLLRLTKRVKPDLLYAHWFTPQAIITAVVARLTGIPFVFTTHASDVSVIGKLPFARRLISWVCENARGYTAVSERTAKKLEVCFTADQWCERFAEKLQVIPMGVQTENSNPPESSIDTLRLRHSLDSRRVVLFLGRLAEKKGVAYLLEGAAMLPDVTRNAFQLVIAGDGQLRRDLAEKARDLGLDNVTFTGHVHGSEKEALLAIADILCIPSIIDSSGDSEGFPVVLMESLAAGKLIIASNVSGAETIFEGDSEMFIFEQKSATQLAAALEQALTIDNQTAVAYRKRNQTLAANYSWPEIAGRYHDFLMGALRNAV